VTPQRALTRLAIALTLSMSTWFSASAVIPQLRGEWDLSRGTAAWLTIAVQLGFVAGALLTSVGNLADVLPPHVVILIGSVGAAAANLLLVVSDGPESAIPLRFATGFFLAGVYPPAFKLMATWFRRGRAFALGTLVAAITVGSALPHLVNGIGGLDWQLVIVATSLLTLVGGFIAWRLVPEGPYPFPRAVFDPRQAGQVFRNRGVRLASLGYFGHMWELFAMWAWFLLFFRDGHGAGGTEAAYATFAVIGIGAIGCIVGGLLAERIGRAEAAAAAMLVSGTCAIVIGLVVDASTWLLLAFGLVWGFSVIADSALFSTLVTEYADQAYVGTALALQLAIGFALTAATIWLIPILEDDFGWKWAFAFLAPGPLLGVLAMLRLSSLQRQAIA
jgi:MFS family permease